MPAPRRLRWPQHAAACLLAALCGLACAADYVQVRAGTLRSVLANDADRTPAPVAPFAMRVTPVTQGEYKRFVAAHPEWQRDHVARTFADSGYLRDWRTPFAPDEAAEQQPVTGVSWFAAQAFCESEDARLPTWMEWEYTAAADATRFDARTDPAWRAEILSWYSRPASNAPRPVGGPANAYGVRDLHGLLWEWVDDFNALLVSPDSRSNDDPDKLKFCGAGAISLQDRENYAVLMRIALLSSLNASDSTSSLGFRCVRPLNQ
jgi:sulfatase modifying factor 1